MEQVVENIRAQSTSVSDRGQIARVASIAAVDEKIGSVDRGGDREGRQGRGRQRGRGPDARVEIGFTEGMQFDQG